MARWQLTLAATLAAGCGDDSAAPGQGSSDSGTETEASSGSTGRLEGSGPATTMAGSGGGTSGEATTAAVDDTAGSSSGGPAWDGEPLPEGDPGQWQWVDIEGTECIDGSPTGLGVRYGDSDNLVIYFEGGGGCFDFGTCSLFYASFANFDENAFNLIVPTLLSNGIFDADEPDNALADWNFVYVPYCTGDVHAGDQPMAEVPGFLGTHQFVGFRNVGLDLERIGATFPQAPHVLVTGISAGGYGAAYNYDRIADGYAGATVTLLDDSGPPMSDTYVAACMQNQWRELWGLDSTLPADCDGCFDEDGWAVDLTLFLRSKHAAQWFGLLSSERDGTIRTFLSGGLNNCIGGLYPGADYEAGLYELRDEILADTPNWASYYLPGISHTYLPFGAYTSTEVQGVRIVDWVADLIAGRASHVSP